MNRFGRGALAGLMLTAAVAGKASAAPGVWGGNGSWCGGSGFSTCFSINLTWTAVTGTSLAVSLQLKNDNPAPGLKWFSVGLDNLSLNIAGPPDPNFFLNSYTVTGPIADWGAPGSNDFNGSPTVDPTASSTWNGSGGGENPIPAGFRTWTFTLTMNASMSAAQWEQMLQAAGVGLHAGGLDAQGCPSTKVIVRDDLAAGPAYGANTGPPSACDQPSPPTEITPEPMTMSLMALGLVGIGGAGLIRRRRKV
jgi:hypothetical protein